MKHPRVALSVLACLCMVACSQSSSDRLLGTWRADEKMATTIYSSSRADADSSKPDHFKPSGPGVPMHEPWEVAISRGKLELVLGPADEIVAGQKVHAPAMRVEKSWSLVSEHGDELVIAIDQDKTLQPILNTIHFVGRDRFWMSRSENVAASAHGSRMWFQRVH